MIYQESNLQEILINDFSFSKIDIERYERALDNPVFCKQLIKLVISIRSNPGRYQSELHKKNTLLKACKNQSDNNYKNNYSSTQSIGDIFRNKF